MAINEKQNDSDNQYEVIYKRNSSYDQAVINRAVDNYKFAKKIGNEKLAQVEATNIYGHTHRFIESFMWKNYKSVMMDDSIREDMMQEIWRSIFEHLKDFDHTRSSITTYMTPWIKHEVSKFTSAHYNKTTPYYAGIIRELKRAQNWCEAHNRPATIENLSDIAHVPVYTIKRALDQMAKAQYTDVYNEEGKENPAIFVSRGTPESELIAKEKQEAFISFLEDELDPYEIAIIRIIDENLFDKRQSVPVKQIVEALDERGIFSGPKQKNNIQGVSKALERIRAKCVESETMRAYLPFSWIVKRSIPQAGLTINAEVPAGIPIQHPGFDDDDDCGI